MLLSQRQQPFYSGGHRAGAPPLPPRRVFAARSSFRAVGALVAAAFVVSAATLALVVQTAGWRGAVFHGVAFRLSAPQLYSAPSTDTLLATELETVGADAGFQQLIDSLNALGDDQDEVAMSVNGAAIQFALAYNGQHVTPGDFVPQEQAHDAPAVLIRPLTTDAARFACILVDIDAPDPANPSHSPFLHYVVANLTRGDNAPPADGQAVPVVVPYYPVSPPMGEHRYVALLMHQSGPALARDEAESARLATHRANFDLVGFARAHSLHLVATSTFYSHPTQQHATVGGGGGTGRA